VIVKSNILKVENGMVQNNQQAHCELYCFHNEALIGHCGAFNGV